MTCRIVIQARLTSSRLPEKALLPVKGLPIAVLCALRAGNWGGDVVVATSTEPSDDPLANTLSQRSIKVIRGSLGDVLGRFVLASADLAPEDLVVRLTADNLFPDGDFINRLILEFHEANVDYLGTNSPSDGLPYGLSAEVFSVGILRQAAASSRTGPEREHVTPWIRKHANCKLATARMFGLAKRYDHLRCTIDFREDYARVSAVFEALDVDPVQVGWRELIEALAQAPDSPGFRIPAKPDENGNQVGILSLGTAQIGMPYGAANSTGLPSQSEATRMVQIAIDHGVTFIDTARAYGSAEARIGAALNSGYRGRATVITKLDPLAKLGNDASRTEIIQAVDTSVMESCRELGVERLDVLMLHRWAHRRQFREVLWMRLQTLRREGAIGSLGASVYSPAEAVEALGDVEIEHIQLPYNLLDWRWSSPEFLNARQNRADVIIHVRSPYLQGILLSDASTWPSGFVDPEVWLGRLNQAVSELNRDSRADLCMAYAIGTPWVTTVVVGAETERQLRDNLALVLRTPLDAQERSYVQALFVDVPERLLNPAMWLV